MAAVLFSGAAEEVNLSNRRPAKDRVDIRRKLFLFMEAKCLRILLDSLTSRMDLIKPQPNTGSSRRDFIHQAAFAGAALALRPLPAAFPSPADDKLGDHFTFLFQGDSITDGNRSRNMDWNHVLGHGYVYLLAARLWYTFPKKDFHFFNRGISGNTIEDLTARWEEDTLALKPDLVSILIGVNDTMHAVGGDKNYTVSSFEEGYRALLKETKRQLPNVVLVICEPFIAPVARVKERWDDYRREIVPRQDIARKLADEFNAVYVPLQTPFDHMIQKYPPAEYWIWDGVHPMPNGHELLAREWLRSVGKNLRFVKS